MGSEVYFYPPKMGKVMLLGLEEVIGKSGVESILRLGELTNAIPNYPSVNLETKMSFETVSLLQKTLEQAYGHRGGRGLAIRAGRACFKYGIKEYGSMMGITEMAFRLLPLQTKLRTGAKSFADL